MKARSMLRQTYLRWTDLTDSYRLSPNIIVAAKNACLCVINMYELCLKLKRMFSISIFFYESTEKNIEAILSIL